jgi:hypothetical protein
MISVCKMNKKPRIERKIKASRWQTMKFWGTWKNVICLYSPDRQDDIHSSCNCISPCDEIALLCFEVIA